MARKTKSAETKKTELKITEKHKTTKTQKSTAPFALSFAAGTLILLNGVLSVIYAMLFPGAVLAGFQGLSYNPAMVLNVYYALTFIAIVFGIIILGGAVMLKNAKKFKKGSKLVVVFSVIGFLVGGGFLIGSVLGTIGGIWGMRRK